jgi:hypothetical protein
MREARTAPAHEIGLDNVDPGQLADTTLVPEIDRTAVGITGGSKRRLLKLAAGRRLGSSLALDFERTSRQGIPGHDNTAATACAP